MILGATKPGDVVLTQGTGGVSIFALQFAKLSGARVIATSSSEGKIAKLLTLRADHQLNSRPARARMGKTGARIERRRGVDLVVEVGGTGTLDELIRATRIGGSIALIGVLAGQRHPTRMSMIVMHQQRIQGVTVGSVRGSGKYDPGHRSPSARADYRSGLPVRTDQGCVRIPREWKAFWEGGDSRRLRQARYRTRGLRSRTRSSQSLRMGVGPILSRRAVRCCVPVCFRRSNSPRLQPSGSVKSAVAAAVKSLERRLRPPAAHLAILHYSVSTRLPC